MSSSVALTIRHHFYLKHGDHQCHLFFSFNYTLLVSFLCVQNNLRHHPLALPRPRLWSHNLGQNVSETLARASRLQLRFLVVE